MLLNSSSIFTFLVYIIAGSIITSSCCSLTHGAEVMNSAQATSNFQSSQIGLKPPNIPIAEYYALEDFYLAANGDDWSFYSSKLYQVVGVPWNFSSINNNPCVERWQGLTCQCTATRCNIEKIILRKYNVRGPLSPAIGSFPQLTELNLNRNWLNGTFPDTLQQLTALTSLSCGFNNFSGPVPTVFSHMTNLTALDISGNELTGTLPASLSSLVNLIVLNFNANRLYGAIPSQLSLIHNLTELLLCCNNFTGTMPSELTTLSNLTRLNLSNNTLVGSINSDICALSQLQQLAMAGNNLTHTIPDCLGNLTALTYLHLDRNNLTGIFVLFFACAFHNNLSDCCCRRHYPRVARLPAPSNEPVLRN